MTEPVDSHPLAKVLVGTDGSTRAQAAVTWAAGFCRATGAKAVVATVVDASDTARIPPRADAPALVAESVMAMNGEDVDCEAIVVAGDPRSVLLEVAGADIDAVVVGTRGGGGFQGLGLGEWRTTLPGTLHVP